MVREGVRCGGMVLRWVMARDREKSRGSDEVALLQWLYSSGRRKRK
jgi:hypothetical protein